MEPLTRRQALILAGAGTASLVVGSTGLLLSADSGSDSAAGQMLVEPRVMRSVNGALKVELSAAEGKARVAGRQATVLAYNGGLPGPTLIVRPGDRLSVSLKNDLSKASNLHVHGLHVSPERNSDNVFVAVEPGESFDYEYRLPDDHPPGVYWYHPHHHGMVAEQIFGGLYGMIIVEDPTPISVGRERVLVISDITLDGSGEIPAAAAMDRMLGREGDLVLVNGQVAPTLTLAPGERERWRIVNACVARYLKLRLDGQHLQLLGMDSGRSVNPHEVDEVVLTPGNRADLLVTGVAGTSVLRSLPVDRGGAMGMMGAGARSSSNSVDVITVEVKGAPVAEHSPVPAQPVQRDLRTESVAATRQLTFAMGMGGTSMSDGGMSFTIDGQPFDPARIDSAVQVGSVEEWTLVNTSTMDHPIHLHVWPMQLVDDQGGSTDDPVWRDVVNVPARSRVRVRIAFDDFPGKTVYHCHILAHEDAGMMGVVEAT
ncbi:multicopper oxidase family protein [Microbacterium sp. KRD172]|uniref:multicopper oxidase family protein n=1 Tax=Microbacterium sp. KRD172 TaxID=2729727 RepID=UPI0019D1FF33|nr:multicopper oxidase family protein [Microbacterium sp. KRD172]